MNDPEIQQALEYCREKYGKHVEVMPGCAMKETCFSDDFADKWSAELDYSRRQPIVQYNNVDHSPYMGLFCFWLAKR